MVVSKKIVNNRGIYGRSIFAFAIIIMGLVLEYLNIGNEFLGFESVGNWLIFVGFIMFAIIILNALNNKKRVVDERMEGIAYKASRITFLFIIISSFIIMVIDGIKPIEISYSMFMSHFMAILLLVYFISYKVIEKYF